MLHLTSPSLRYARAVVWSACAVAGCAAEPIENLSRLGQQCNKGYQLEAASVTTAFLAGEAPVGGMVVGDLDGDGIPDVAVITPIAGGSQFATLRGKCGGGLEPAVITHLLTAAQFLVPQAIALADGNADGRPDVFIALRGAGAAQDQLLFLANDAPQGFGAFKQQLTPVFDQGGLPVSGYVGALAAKDLNGDGWADAAVAIGARNGLPAEVALFAGGVVEMGAANLQLVCDGSSGALCPSPGAAIAVVAEDLDADGVPDLAVADDQQAVTLFKGQSTNNGAFSFSLGASGAQQTSFAPPAFYPALPGVAGQSLFAMVAADFDGDQINDLAVLAAPARNANLGQAQLIVLFGAKMPAPS